MIKLMIYGFLIGVAKIIPGFSGAVLAIFFGVYDKTLNVLANLNKISLKDILYLFVLGISILGGIILASNLIIVVLSSFYFQTMLFVIGLIMGSFKNLIPAIKGYNKVKGLCLFVMTFIFMLTLQTNTFNLNLSNYFFLGFMEIFTTLIPGLSGTVIYMFLNVYDELLDFYANIYEIPFLQVFSFVFGALLGIIIVSKVLAWVLKKHKQSLMIIIFSFMFLAILALFKEILFYRFTIIDLFSGTLLFVTGYMLIVKTKYLL